MAEEPVSVRSGEQAEDCLFEQLAGSGEGGGYVGAEFLTEFG